MTHFKGLDNKSIINNAIASGLENFEINGNKIFDGSGEYSVMQVNREVIEIIKHDKSHNDRGSYFKWTITIEDNRTPLD